MAKKHAPSEHWKDEPEDHDFPAAADYLSLLLPAKAVAATVAKLRTADTQRHKAKNLIRSGRLTLLPVDDPEVVADLKKVAKGEHLSPVLLVRGRADKGVPLTVADGYHRICASYHIDENAEIPCRIADLA